MLLIHVFLFEITLSLSNTLLLGKYRLYSEALVNFFNIFNVVFLELHWGCILAVRCLGFRVSFNNELIFQTQIVTQIFDSIFYPTSHTSASIFIISTLTFQYTCLFTLSPLQLQAPVLDATRGYSRSHRCSQ